MSSCFIIILFFLHYCVNILATFLSLPCVNLLRLGPGPAQRQQQECQHGLSGGRCPTRLPWKSTNRGWAHISKRNISWMLTVVGQVSVLFPTLLRHAPQKTDLVKVLAQTSSRLCGPSCSNWPSWTPLPDNSYCWAKALLPGDTIRTQLSSWNSRPPDMPPHCPCHRMVPRHRQIPACPWPHTASRRLGVRNGPNLCWSQIC